MFDRVAQLLSEYLKVDRASITPETDIKRDLNADSLVVVEMLFTLEEEMGMTIPDEMIEQLTKVGALVDYIEKNKTK